MCSESISADLEAAVIRSSPSLPTEANPSRTVDLRPIGTPTGERVVHVHGTAGHLTDLADQLEHGKIERQIDEIIRAGERLFARRRRHGSPARHRNSTDRRVHDA